MNFDNLTNEQIAWLEGKVEEAYEEGYSDGYYDMEGYYQGDSFDFSLAKNQTCHILAERYMVPVEA